MSQFLRAFALSLAAAALILAAFSFQRPAHAAEFDAGQHWSVMIHACDATHCENFKRPTEADSEIQCQMTVGMMGAMQWGVQHQSWTVKKWRCAKDGEAEL
jgi:hypothetical protein